jgi:hypothetical protein
MQQPMSMQPQAPAAGITTEQIQKVPPIAVNLSALPVIGGAPCGVLLGVVEFGATTAGHRGGQGDRRRVVVRPPPPRSCVVGGQGRSCEGEKERRMPEGAGGGRRAQEEVEEGESVAR